MKWWKFTRDNGDATHSKLRFTTREEAEEALAWLENKRMLSQQEHDGAKDALKWAARTYVVAAIGSIGTLLYYVSLYMGNSRRD